MARGIKNKKISEYRTRIPKKPKRTILIAVEGNNKTEKLYFNHFNNIQNNYVMRIAKGNTTDPVNMVKGLILEIKKLNIDVENEDRVYCVFDTDDKENKNHQILEAITLASKNNIRIITSNPCFEEWILCHFEKSTARLTNKEAFHKVRSYLPQYDKNCDVYPLIYNHTKKAVRNAKFKENYHLNQEKNINLVESNPSTQVYKIIEELNK